MKKLQDEPFVVGPLSNRLTRADLPSPNTARWTPRRKAEVVAAVEGGLISREAALTEYRLSEEEYGSWKAQVSRFGLRGLCVTKVDLLRRDAKRISAKTAALANG